MVHHEKNKRQKMVSFRSIFKRSVLALVAATVALTFAQTGERKRPASSREGSILWTS